jgi:hypothetical protein
MKASKVKFVLCLRNDDCDDIEVRKIYQALPDKRAEKDGYLRIVDESGEDYLYPESYFLFIELPQEVYKQVFAA